ncbi:phosphatidylinositol-specific phospholipase C1-like protein [Novosphingobium sp. 1949]|uniref:Phosphatidylinositol-specific phospholipase C1-like protein n=1 Tax=Novosphingobium organovorum TaxID=2930092 RepID=A0ABT0BHZ9_9SPHN|nr:phosphatidylinositol-specific phospholipase C1-like protein [Novosphingobium organovorum]MCJ2184473.1 phosphatidylinositol-specific phospholipase C1-like protein [Novosphingobium organovorum]
MSRRVAPFCPPLRPQHLAIGLALCGMLWGLCAQPLRAEEAPLRLNDILAIGTHNSYKQAIPAQTMARLRAKDPALATSLDYAHRPLREQLDVGARQIELDVWYDPKGGLYAMGARDPDLLKPGFKVQHMAGLDTRSSCARLVQCLTILRDWSDAHPGHTPILLMFNTYDSSPLVKAAPFTEAAYDALDAEVRSVLAPEKLITPDDVQGAYPTLRDAVLADNWPTLAEARGRFLFALDENARKVALYRGKRRSLEGRVFFVNTDADSPAAAYMTINDPLRDAARIRAAVKAGFLVRTRADDGTIEARANDTARLKAALASGAQYVSSDYLWPDPRFHNAYHLALPGGARVLCNPVRRPEGCPAPALGPDNGAQAAK